MKKSLSLINFHKPYSELKDSIISLVILTHNDEEIIAERLAEIYKTLKMLSLNFEIIVIDNCSQDKTVETIKNNSEILRYCRILVLSKEYDTEVALAAGMDNCVGDYCILFDIYTDPVEMIPYLISNKLLSGNDVVIAKFSKNLHQKPFLTKLIIALSEKLSTRGYIYRENYLTGLSRKALNSMIRTRRKSRNLTYLQSLIGLKKEIVEYKPIGKYISRIKTETTYSTLSKLIDTLLSNSFKPLRFISFSGMFFSALYIVYVLVIIIISLTFGRKELLPKGWITLSTVMGSMFFFLFSLLSVISEYIIRIMNESRDEPFYFISEEINKSSILPKKNTLNVI